MPRPTKKSACAKAQQQNGDQHFTTAKYFDSASEYAISAKHSSISDSDVSSLEAEDHVVLPGSITEITKMQVKECLHRRFQTISISHAKVLADCQAGLWNAI